jgi:hypothetical protein
MLSTVLKGDRAITVNIRIMRAFVQLREMLASNKELARRFAQLETRLDKKLTIHDEAIAAILSAIRQLMHPPVPKRRPIGFTANLREKVECLRRGDIICLAKAGRMPILLTRIHRDVAVSHAPRRPSWAGGSIGTASFPRDAGPCATLRANARTSEDNLRQRTGLEIDAESQDLPKPPSIWAWASCPWHSLFLIQSPAARIGC